MVFYVDTVLRLDSFYPKELGFLFRNQTMSKASQTSLIGSKYHVKLIKKVW
jgi:hypothetical protein